MGSHTFHPDSHEAGLADDCPRCTEHGEHPFDGLDDRNLMMLAHRVEADLEPRSENEGRAMREVERVMLCARRLAKLGVPLG